MEDVEDHSRENHLGRYDSGTALRQDHQGDERVPVQGWKAFRCCPQVELRLRYRVRLPEETGSLEKEIIMVGKVPKEVRAAIRALAKAVKITSEIYERPFPNPQSLYHVREYLDDMEDLLVQQVLTAFPDVQSGEEFLSSCGLDYLHGNLLTLAEQWNGVEP